MAMLRNDSNEPTSEVRTVRPTTQSPGKLRGESWMTLQTREAQRLVTGRSSLEGKPAIIGLTRFGALMSPLYFAARLDDPWVDWWLVQIEETFLSSQRELEDLQSEVKTIMTSNQSIQVDVALSVEPIRIPLQFSNPYSYQAAVLIGAYDQLICSTLTARHTGFLARKKAEDIKTLGGKAVRRSLLSPTKFPRGVVASREDLRQQSARAKQAIEKYGLPPEHIISGEQRGEFAPAIMAIKDPRLKNTISAPLDQAETDELDQPEGSSEAL